MIKNIILITGAGRSGTSILGKLLGSCKRIEYLFEPELLNCLLLERKKINFHSWRNLVELYLRENLLNLINGRTINFRDGEESSIKSIKSSKEIDLKFTKTISGLKFYEYINRKKIILLIKHPDIINIDFLSQAFPNMKLIIIKRNPYNIIKSLLKKKMVQK